MMVKVIVMMSDPIAVYMPFKLCFVALGPRKDFLFFT